MLEASTAPKITIVIPAYNAASFILPCLQSLQAQDCTNWRCLVVDDGSTDDTAAKVEGLGDARIALQRQANGGVSRARNRGLEQVSTPFVMFLDADDLLHPAAINRLLQGFEKANEAVASFGSLRKILANGHPYPGEKPLAQMRYPDGNVLEAMVRENFLANGGQVLIRTDAARRAGAFNPLIRLSEDWVFWCRLALTGQFHYIGNTPEVFSLRVSAASTSGALACDWDNHRPAIENVLGDAEIAARFTPGHWRRLGRYVRASHLWEAGRVNFTFRRFSISRRLMLASLFYDPRPKRIALFGLAQLSQLTGRALVSRLRFRDSDEALIR